MELHHLHRHLLLVCSFSFSLSAPESGDVAAISDIAKSFVGVPSNWKPGTNHCNWDGIKCTNGRITSLNLNSKDISGALSDSLAKLSSLNNLDLGRNHISGPFPSLAGLSALQTLDIEANTFSSIPDDLFSGLTGLRSVRFDNNPFAPWSIPPGLGQCTSLLSFSAANASITGRIPEVFDQLHDLMELKLSYNNLTSGLPSSFAGSNIQMLHIDNQQNPGLLGRIDVIGSMPHLHLVMLQSNSLVGAIPDLSKLNSLTSFTVRDNLLTGPIPPSLTSCPTLKEVALSNNKLQGPFPKFSSSVMADVSKGNKFCNSEPGPCDPRVTALLSVAGGFGYPINLAQSWEGNDPCSPKWTGDTVTCDDQGKEILVLNFASMPYSGIISPDIANLTSLTKIILNDNNLTGPIPDSLTKLPKLQLLDVTNNNLTGKIPDFLPSVTLKASGNPRLVSGSNPGPFDAGGSSRFGGTPETSSNENSSCGSCSSHKAITGAVITFVFLLVCCLACFIYYNCHKNYAKRFRQAHTQSLPNEQGTNKISMLSNVQIGAKSMLFSIQALEKATNDFCEANILGRGAFSLVYKGEHNGTLIAVKRNVSGSVGSKGMEEFRAEIDLLKNVRHRYLVALLGYCISAKERILVYEYMPNGTLAQHLFDPNGNKYSSLSWNQRLTIAVDVARGIEYLHDLAQECFIHRDLNPSNILLDKYFRAKLSSFGLIKLVDNGDSIQTQLAGKFGYLAPEYAITGKISTKVDVYAFGVILMELITGRRVIDESLPVEESHLVKCFRREILDKKFMNYVDPTLDLDEEACSNMSDVAELACHCTAREPNQRPDMGHVVNALVPFVEKWNPGHCDDEVSYKDDSSTSLPQKLRKWLLDDGTFTWNTDDRTSMTNSFSGRGGNRSTRNNE